MREIKFRIYDKELKETHIEELQDLCEDDIWYDGETEVWSVLEDCNNKQKRFVALQNTGLHDKNGKEIYEGDIVKVPVKRHSSSNWWQDTNINHGETGDFVYKQVKYFEYTNSFSDNLSGFDLADLPITKKQKEEIAKPRGKERIKQCVDDLNYTFIELEVIGNIYENPELLERSSNGD